MLQNGSIFDAGAKLSLKKAKETKPPNDMNVKKAKVDELKKAAFGIRDSKKCHSTKAVLVMEVNNTKVHMTEANAIDYFTNNLQVGKNER